jgi:hypothetical protein
MDCNMVETIGVLVLFGMAFYGLYKITWKAMFG